MATTRTRKPPVEAVASLPPPERPSALTPDVLRDLRRPYEADAIRFKPQTANLDKASGLATFYIDARLAAERLNAVVGPENWHDSYRLIYEGNPAAHAAAFFAVECSLTVFGVTKTDVGVYQKSKPDALAIKSAYSDALKRAAVKFGVGAFLYACPKLFGDLKIVGQGERRKAVGFTPAAEQKLRDTYESWMATDACALHYGSAMAHGDAGQDPDDPADDAPASDTPPATSDAPKPETTPTSDTQKQRGSVAMVTSKAKIDGLVALAVEAGITRADALKIVKAEHTQHGGYRQSWYQEQTQFLNTMIADKAKEAA